MSDSSLDSGGRAVTTGGPRDHPADSSEADAAETLAGNGRSEPAPGTAAARAALGLDRRLRGKRAEPTGDIPVASRRTDRQLQHRRRGLLAKMAGFVIVAALAVLLLQTFVIAPFAVPGDAMAPTLRAGDRVLVLKWGLLADPIHSGEIVVFHPPRALPCTVVAGAGGDLMLRVVALPGQTIRSAGDTIVVNGRPLRERGWYDAHYGQVGSTPIRSTTLGSRQYFVMADNRSDACDSRVFGAISQSSIVGKAIAVIGRNRHLSFGTL